MRRNLMDRLVWIRVAHAGDNEDDVEQLVRELPVQAFNRLLISDIEARDSDAAVCGRRGGSEPGSGATLGRNDVPTVRRE
jgi:hypothetical protein